MEIHVILTSSFNLSFPSTPSDLVVMINNTGNTSPTLSTQPSTKTVAQLPTWPSKPINPLQPALGQIKKTTTTERVAPTLWEMTELTLEQTTAEVRNPNVKNEMERVPVEEVIEDVVEEFANPPEWVKNRNAKKKTMPVLDFEPLRDVEFDELPEFGMDLKTSDQNVEANVDDTTNENNVSESLLLCINLNFVFCSLYTIQLLNEMSQVAI